MDNSSALERQNHEDIVGFESSRVNGQVIDSDHLCHVIADERPPGLAFSCKGRDVCPSCSTRRMVETAAHMGEPTEPQTEKADLRFPDLILRSVVARVCLKFKAKGWSGGLCFWIAGKTDPSRAYPLVMI